MMPRFRGKLMTRREILAVLRAGHRSGVLKEHLMAMTDEELIAEAERIFNTAKSVPFL